jgi:violaxanthin de-epoxidase
MKLLDFTTLLCIWLVVYRENVSEAFAPRHPSLSRPSSRTTSAFSRAPILSLRKYDSDSEVENDLLSKLNPFQNWQTALQTTALALTIGVASWTSLPTIVPPAFAATTDSKSIVSCLFQKCPLPLAKCVANPKCLANVVCINTCTGRPDEIECQIECGNLFENEVVGEFNKCVLTDMKCVPKQGDDGSYPVPAPEIVVPKFDTKFFDGRLYISAGQNKLFDVFPCQVHFFTETEKGKFFGKLNWRVEQPDGNFFTRDALQEFVQDPNQPGHLINHDNEYLHYEDDWWVIDYEYDGNKDGVPPFAFVYYRGNNDAWEGYGGVVVYTRAAQLPESLLPRLRVAAEKIGFDFDKDFVITDNTCPTDLSGKEKQILREKFAGKVALQTEQQLQAQVTRLRGNAVNSIKAQKLFFEQGLEGAQKAYDALEETEKQFEQEASQQ